MRFDRTTLKFLLCVVLLTVGIAIGYAVAYIAGASPSSVPLISSAIGLCLAFAVPIWQTYFLNAPKLSVEITSIKRTVSDQAVIALQDFPELQILKKNRRIIMQPPVLALHDLVGRPAVEASSALKISDLDDLLNRTKQEYKDLPEKIEERRKELEEISKTNPAEFTRWDCARYNRPLSPEVEFDQDNKERTLELLQAEYKKRFDILEKRHQELQRDLPITERKLEILRDELINNRSFFTISASLINSGRTNSAIKVPALLRVVIGEGNYIDLKLSLKDFEEKSEISANGTRIVVFESSEISSLPEEDRRLINTYWGQSVRSRLYIENITSMIYQSNQIPFAEGLYQKIIYDRLAQEATLRSQKLSSNA